MQVKTFSQAPPPQKGEVILQVMQLLQKWSVTCIDGIKDGCS